MVHVVFLGGSVVLAIAVSYPSSRLQLQHVRGVLPRGSARGIPRGWTAQMVVGRKCANRLPSEAMLKILDRRKHPIDGLVAVKMDCILLDGYLCYHASLDKHFTQTRMLVNLDVGRSSHLGCHKRQVSFKLIEIVRHLVGRGIVILRNEVTPVFLRLRAERRCRLID